MKKSILTNLQRIPKDHRSDSGRFSAEYTRHPDVSTSKRMLKKIGDRWKLVFKKNEKV